MNERYPPDLRFRDYAAVFGLLAILLLALLLIPVAGCETPAPISPEVDDAFCLVLCIAVELQPANEVATYRLPETPQPFLTEAEVASLLKKQAGARNSRVANEDGERPAVEKAADKTPLSFITPIILHTKANCPPCREVKAALVKAGIPFTEHTTADVAPVAFVDDERFEGYKILDRFNLSRESK